MEPPVAGRLSRLPCKGNHHQENHNKGAQSCTPKPIPTAVPSPPSPSEQGRLYPVELHVEPAGVADGLSLGVPAPERGRRRVAVGTGEADAAGGRLGLKTGEEKASTLCGSHQQHLRSLQVSGFPLASLVARGA